MKLLSEQTHILSKTIDWIESVKEDGQPFMVKMHHKAPHRTWEPGPKYLNRFQGVQFPEPFHLFDDYSGMGKAALEQDLSIEVTMSHDGDLIKWPERIKPGSVNKNLVSNLDFAQTFLDAAGLPDPPELHTQLEELRVKYDDTSLEDAFILRPVED